MTNFKYLQKLFFLLVMGFPNDSIADDITNPTDSIPSEDVPVVPNDSVADGGTIVVNGYEAVDLGLSVKWACCNVGANVPEGYGGYYAWGETEEKSDYTEYTYKYVRDLDGDGNYWDDEDNWMNIGSNISGIQYDVAHVKWGGSWRMPTLDEIKELVNKCSWKWTSLNGVSGQLVTGPNGNSIFLPAAGSRRGAGLFTRGSRGYYWSATLYEYFSSLAYNLYFYDGYDGWNYWDYRYDGHAVRPVTE